MPEPIKKTKVIRLNYKKKYQDQSPFIALLGGKEPELRLGANAKTFMSIKEQGISLSPGLGNSITIQGMSHNMTYGGMLFDLPFPLSLMPVTTFNPFPKQFMTVPFLGLFGNMIQLGMLGSSMLGI